MKKLIYCKHRRVKLGSLLNFYQNYKLNDKLNYETQFH